MITLRCDAACLSAIRPRLMELSVLPRQYQDVQADTDDNALVARARTGDRDAFADLYERHQGAIFRFALHMTGATASAEDVVQEAFVAFMHALDSFEGDRSVRAYLYGIARHIAARRLRRERLWVSLNDEAHEPASEPPSFVEDLQRRDDLLHLRQAIFALPRKHREVIVLCDLEQLSYEEAAASIGCAVGTIRSRLHRARTTLAGLVQRVDPDARRFSRRPEKCVL
jgi:RNA polymerase sigma-70 factor (ECF subfamily)